MREKSEMSLILFLIFIINFVIFESSMLPSLHAQENNPDQKSSNKVIFNQELNVFIKEAVQNNPDLLSFDGKILAAQASFASKKFIDPPQIGVEFMQAPFSSFPNPLKDQMEIDFFIQQEFPFPGKLSAMAKPEQIKTELYTDEKKVKELDLQYSLKKAFFEHYYLCRQLEIINENYDLIKQLTQITSKQYELGMGKQFDILRAQAELTSIKKQQITTTQERRSAEAMMNSITNRPVDSSMKTIPEIEVTFFAVTLKDLEPLALKNRAELDAMNQDILMQKAEAKALSKEVYPDFMVKGTYKGIKESSENYWGVMFGMTLPMMPWELAKNNYLQKSIAHTIEQRKKEYENMKLMILSQIQDALLKVNSYQELVELYKNTSIPQAQQTLQSTLAAYKAGKTEFLMLIDASRMLLMAKQDYQMSVMNLLLSQASLERATGLGIDEITTVLNKRE